MLFEFIFIILLIVILMKLSDMQHALKNLEDQLRLLPRNPTPTTTQPKVQPATPVTQPIPKIPEQRPIQEKPVPTPPKPKKPSLGERLRAKYPDLSLEELLFGNIILKIAIIAFILGIGLFLKYSIDKNWIPIWGRVLIGIMVGIGMLVGGIRMIGNRHKLFSESLFGGGIAVLYLSIFASFALEGFKFLPHTYAFAAMILITILAGLISVRYDAKSTAVFGLIGGFATPFLLSTDSGNIVGLLSYMLMLNLGVLFISIYKKWSLLAWLAFIITTLTSLATVWDTDQDFIPLALLYGLFFIIYSIVPFINEIKEQREALQRPFLLLFGANFVAVILNFLALFQQYDIELIYYAVVTILLAAYLLAYAYWLSRKSLFIKNLFTIVLAQAMAMLLVTPAFLFSGASLTIVWAVESLMLLWVSTRNGESTYAHFALIGFTITLVRYVLLDMIDGYSMLAYLEESREPTLIYLKNLTVSSLFVLGSLFAGYKLLRQYEVTFRYVASDRVRMGLFFNSFVWAFIGLTLMMHLVMELYLLPYSLLLFILIIALFAYLLSISLYAVQARAIFSIFMALLGVSFIMIVTDIDSDNT